MYTHKVAANTLVSSGYLFARVQASVLLREIEAKRGRGKSKGPWPSWGKFVIDCQPQQDNPPTPRENERIRCTAASPVPPVNSCGWSIASPQLISFTPPHPFAGPVCILIFIPHMLFLHSLASARQACGRYLPAAYDGSSIFLPFPVFSCISAAW